MTWRKELLDYRVAEDFHVHFYKDLLTEEHLMNDGQLVRLTKLTEPSGGEDRNFWGWQFKKNNKVYLVSVFDDKKNQVKLKDILPIKIKAERMVAFQKEVFHEIVNYASAKFKPTKHYTLKEITNMLTMLSCTNKAQQKLNLMLELQSYFGNIVYRVASPPNMGKDSMNQLFNSLFGKFHTIAKPSPAKLHYEISICKSLKFTEIPSWAKSDWDFLEPLLLNCADGKPSVQKSTRAGYGVGDTIDIMNLSLGMFYNDIDRYVDTKKWIDFVTNDAIPDRFVPFRFWNTITENFSEWDHNTMKDYGKTYVGDYKKILETTEFYKQNLMKEMHKWKRTKLDYTDMSKRNRWKNQLSKLLNVVDVCSETQEEFDYWINEINMAISDYAAMLLYPKYLPGLYSKMKIPKTAYEKFSETKIQDALHYLEGKLDKDDKGNTKETESNRKNLILIQYINNIINANTFIQRVQLIQCYNSNNEITISDNSIRDW